MQGLPKPTHPLISIVDVSQWEIPEQWIGFKSTTDLYSIALKDKSCGMLYGRNKYDFDEGVMIFTAPNQVQQVTKAQQLNEIKVPGHNRYLATPSPWFLLSLISGLLLSLISPLLDSWSP